MMIEQATVLHYQDGKALVQCQAKQGCGSCAVKSSCGSRALSGLVGERVAPQFEIAVDQVLEKGDQIQLGLAEKTLLSSVFLLYGVPLLTLILSAVILSEIWTNELGIASGLFFCTACSFLWVKRIIASKQFATLTPHFLGKVSH